MGNHHDRSLTGPEYENLEGWATHGNEEFDLELETGATDLASARSIKDHHSRIQMDYYAEPRQYNALEADACKYPTRTHLIEGQSTAGVLRFSDLRERPNVDVGAMAYHDQKEFFRLDREHDQLLIEQHEWKTRKSLNQVGRALNANLNRERINIFKQFLNDSKRQTIKMNHLCMSSRIPRVALTDKSAALQPSKFVKTTEKVTQPYRRDIAENVAERYDKAQSDNKSPRVRESAMFVFSSAPTSPSPVKQKASFFPASKNVSPRSQLQQYLPIMAQTDGSAYK